MSDESESPAATPERRRSRSAPRRADRDPERAVPVDALAAEPPTPLPSQTTSAHETSTMPPETSNPPRPAPTSATAPEGQTKPTADQKPGTEGEAAEAQPPKALSPIQEAAQKLEIIKENKDAFEWVLKQHSELRVEFISFLRKDMKEIQQVLAEVKNLGVGEEMALETMEMIKNTYIEHWRKSFDLITPDNVLKPAKPLGAPEDVAKGWFKNNG